MQKRHFEMIAAAIHRTGMASKIGRKKRTPEDTLRLLVTDLSASMKHVNPRFDVDRFRAACGL